MGNRIGNTFITSGITGGIICSIFCDLATPFITVTLFIFAWGVLLYFTGRLSSDELMIPVIMGVSAFILTLVLNSLY